MVRAEAQAVSGDELEDDDGDAVIGSLAEAQPKPKHTPGVKRMPAYATGSISDPETVAAIVRWLEREVLAAKSPEVAKFLSTRLANLRSGDWRLRSHQLRRSQPKRPEKPSRGRRASVTPPSSPTARRR